MPVFRALMAVGVALALADASVVALALPPMLADLDTTVEGLAAVIGVYTLVLAALLPVAAGLRRRVSDAVLGVAGFGVFALAGALCSLPDELAPMLAFRALQAAGAAAALVAGFALLRGGRLWATAAVLGTAVGPALGGALTQAFDWRAIFIAQVPLALAAAAASVALRRGDESPRGEADEARRGEAAMARDAGGSARATRGAAAGAGDRSAAEPNRWAAPDSRRSPAPPGAPAGGGAARAPAAGGASRAPAHGGSIWARPVRTGEPAMAGESSVPSGSGRPAVTDPGRDARALVARAGAAGALAALAALSAALTAVLFLLVLLLVAGWSLEPLTAAAAVSVLPVAAFAGARIRAPAPVRASAGCALTGAGVLALAVLPGAEPAWIVAPQVLAGVGMGMALPALAGGLLPERTPGQAAWLLCVRHAGITLALVLIAPIAASQLDAAVADVRERGAALMLDARLPPLDKIQLAGPLVADLDPVNPRDGLRAALDAQAERFAGDPDQRREYAELTERADETLVAGIEDAFRIAFVIAGALALAGAFAVLPREPRSRTLALAAIAGALVLPALHAAARPAIAPEPVAIADPCAPRDLPATGGIDGVVQDAALTALDRAACRFGSSREELALALADEDEARAYEDAHGVDPRSTDGLLELLGISLG